MSANSTVTSVKLSAMTVESVFSRSATAEGKMLRKSVSAWRRDRSTCRKRKRLMKMTIRPGTMALIRPTVRRIQSGRAGAWAAAHGSSRAATMASVT